MPVAALIGGAMSLAGNIAQNYIQDRRDAEARSWQEKMLREANAYNSPSSVMARMKQAGINPNLVVGQPVSPSANVAQPAQGSRSASFDDIASSAFQAHNIASQLKMQREINDSNINLQSAESELKREQARQLKMENDAKENGGRPPVSDSSSYEIGEPVRNADGSISLPEVRIIEHNPNYYEASVSSQMKEFANTEKRISDENTLRGQQIAIGEEQVKDARERAKHRVEFLEQELRRSNLSNDVLEREKLALLRDCYIGLVSSLGLTFDSDGKPIGLKHQTYETVMKELERFLGVGATSSGIVEGIARLIISAAK